MTAPVAALADQVPPLLRDGRSEGNRGEQDFSVTTTSFNGEDGGQVDHGRQGRSEPAFRRG